MRENGFTRKTYEEELAMIEAEGGTLMTANDETNRRANANNTDTDTENEDEQDG